MNYISENFKKLHEEIIKDTAKYIVGGVFLFLSFILSRIIPKQTYEYFSNKIIEFSEIIQLSYSWIPRWLLITIIFAMLIYIWKLTINHKKILIQKDNEIKNLENARKMLKEVAENNNKRLPIITKFNAQWDLNNPEPTPLCFCHSKPLTLSSNSDTGASYMVCKIGNLKGFTLKRDNDMGISLEDAKAEIKKIRDEELSKKSETK